MICVMLFMVTNKGSLKLAEMVDKVYAQKLRKAVQNDVEIIAMDTVINTLEIRITNALPVDLH